MLTETRVYIARYLCPDGHCLMTASGEGDAEEPDVGEIDQLVEASLNKLIEDGAVTPWCGICGAVREEALLPELEYEGEHKIPIIPEPLGIISLGRRERRVDPLSSMMSALLIVSVAVALMVWLVVRPPWVPGS